MSNSSIATGSSSKSMFGYDASMPMAWIGGILFSISVAIHIYQYIRYKAWYLYLLLLGVLMEAFGYWTRVVAIKDPNNNAANSMSYLLTTLAPSFIAAACYMTFGRIIYWVTPEDRRGFRHVWFPARFVTMFFVFWDGMAFSIQGIGVIYLIANLTKKDQTAAQVENALAITYDVLRVGFVMQIIVFGVFVLLAIRFMFASKNWRYDWPEQGSARWRSMAWVIVICTSLVAGRSLYRCLEFTLNRGNNYLRDHEWPFYLFDMVVILLIMIALNLWHPGRQLPIEYTTIRHGYKKAGFKETPAVKTVSEDAGMPTAGYSRVSLVPPPLAPANSNTAPQMNQVTNPAMHFSDPWNNRPSPGADRY